MLPCEIVEGIGQAIAIPPHLAKAKLDQVYLEDALKDEQARENKEKP